MREYESCKRTIDAIRNEQSGGSSTRQLTMCRSGAISPLLDCHYQNFIDCVKSRQVSYLIADIEEGHYSALLCHLGNIAYRTGRRLVFDPQTETFPSDDQANQLLGREYRRGYELPRI